MLLRNERVESDLMELVCLLCCNLMPSSEGGGTGHFSPEDGIGQVETTPNLPLHAEQHLTREGPLQRSSSMLREEGEVRDDQLPARSPPCVGAEARAPGWWIRVIFVEAGCERGPFGAAKSTVYSARNRKGA